MRRKVAPPPELDKAAPENHATARKQKYLYVSAAPGFYVVNFQAAEEGTLRFIGYDIRGVENLDEVTRASLALLEGGSDARGRDSTLAWLVWGLGNAALQSGDITAAEVLLAVAGALQTPQVDALPEFHRLARRVLQEAQTNRRTHDFLRSYGLLARIEISTKSALGRELVDEFRRQKSAEEPDDAFWMTTTIVSILRIGQMRLKILANATQDELSERVRRAIDSGLPADPEAAAVAVLQAAGMSFKEAHNAVNAAENMKTRRAKHRP